MLYTLMLCLASLSPRAPTATLEGVDSRGEVPGRQLAAKVNRMRLSQGLQELEYDTTLAYIAMEHSQNQATCEAVSHYDCTDDDQGSSFFDRMRAYCPSARFAAENVGACSQAGRWTEMFDLWNASKPHHLNMVSQWYTSIGVARWCIEPAETQHQHALCYWTAVFVAPPGSCTAPVFASSACPPLSTALSVILLLLPLVFGR